MSHSVNTPTLDLTEVLAGVLADPAFAAPEEFGNASIMTFLQFVPDLMHDLLDQPVSIALLAEATLRFSNFLLLAEYPQWFFQAENPKTYDLPAWVDHMSVELSDSVLVSQQLISDPEGYLNEIGRTESDFLLSDFYGLSIPLRKLYLQGKLTLRDVMIMQPTIVLFDF